MKWFLLDNRDLNTSTGSVTAPKLASKSKFNSYKCLVWLHRGSLLCCFFVMFFNCSSGVKSGHFMDYPKLDTVSVTDNYFGTQIADPYRHLENLKDSTVIRWFKDQDTYTEQHLKTLPNQEQITSQMRDYFNGESTSYSLVKYADNGFQFFLKTDSKDRTQKLYYKENVASKAVELFNPTKFQPDLNREYTVNYIQPSWNGNHVLVSLGYNGIKGSSLVIVDVINRKVLPEIVTHAEPEYYLGVSWLPDSSGFLYLYIPELDSSKPDYMLNPSTVLYKLGENPDRRRIVFSSSSDKSILKEDMPIAKILSKQDKYIIGYKASSENYWEAFYASIEDLKTENIHWKPFYGKDEKIYADYGYFIDGTFVFISGKHGDNRTISSFNLSEVPLHSKVLVPEKKDEVISSLYVANNNLYYSTSKFGVEANLYEYKDGVEHAIELPSTSGNISIYSTSNENPNLYVGTDGWINDYTRYIYSNGIFSLDPLNTSREYEAFQNFSVKELQVTSFDGTQIPMSLVFRHDIVLNGENPTLLYAYGAYGESLSPFFSPIFLNWIHNGGVLAVPHIRGGGEKGDSWHEAGMKLKKSNSWKDLISCTEYLIKNHYTSKEKTVLYSSSAGGIAIGMAMVERPGLYEVFIADVPMLNPLRSESRSNNASNYLEYGTIKDSLECMGLIKMDPYVNLKPNTNYPASLIISGFNDARIDPWIPGKFVAKLQTHSTSKAPVLLDVNFEAGHDGGDTLEERIAEYSRIFAFAFWQTNHKLEKNKY